MLVPVRLAARAAAVALGGVVVVVVVVALVLAPTSGDDEASERGASSSEHASPRSGRGAETALRKDLVAVIEQVRREIDLLEGVSGAPTQAGGAAGGTLGGGSIGAA